MEDILVENGKIKKIAPVLEGKIINDADVIDATGIDVYPGFVDAHCHMGLDGYATGFAGEDYNELGDPVTPQLSAVDAVNPQDETFQMAREGGVTCVCTGPGSSNVIYFCLCECLPQLRGNRHSRINTFFLITVFRILTESDLHGCFFFD